MVFTIIALVSIIGFYTIYGGKMILQQKQGIQTNQMAHGEKPRRLVIQETVLKIVTFLVVPMELVSIGFNWSLLPDGIRYIGSVLGILGVIVFFIAVYTMKDSWRAGITNDETKLVTTGIYKYSRNPAFVGFYLLYIGVLLAFFNYYLLVISLAAILLLHRQIRHEEKSLIAHFGSDYIEYMKQVRRY